MVDSRPADPDRRHSDDRREDRRRPKAGRRITDLSSYPDAWLSVPVVAEYLAVDVAVVRTCIETGQLAAHLFDGTWRVRRIDLQAFVEKSGNSVR
ncbi:MAG TPA: helix-turn-helix domain-containing protein [Vicinamibacterales bacterium]|nr:helix-turn-helix domain-containing protein [Vicinamibacterales bacterium]